MLFKELSRREREVLIILYQLNKASVREVETRIGGDTSYSTIRTILGTLVKKGYASYQTIGLRYIYCPVINHNIAASYAIKDIVATFYDDDLERASIDLLLTLFENMTETQRVGLANRMVQNETLRISLCSDVKQ